MDLGFANAWLMNIWARPRRVRKERQQLRYKEHSVRWTRQAWNGVPGILNHNGVRTPQVIACVLRHSERKLYGRLKEAAMRRNHQQRVLAVDGSAGLETAAHVALEYVPITWSFTCS